MNNGFPRPSGMIFAPPSTADPLISEDALKDGVKTTIQFIDPTGITSYGDVKNAYNKYRDGTGTLGNLALEILGALPMIGKVTKPVRAAIRAANATSRSSKGLNKANKVVDTVGELIPVVNKVAKGTQDITSTLITNPIARYALRNYPLNTMSEIRKAPLWKIKAINTGADVVNFGNNYADLTQYFK